MPFVGIFTLTFGYAAVYTAVQMVKRAPGGQSGSVLYWLTGITSLGAPSGTSSGSSPGGSGSRKPTSGRDSSNAPPQRTGRGTHSQ